MNIFPRYRTPLICVVLILTTLFAYWEVHNHEFVNYDDNVYITDNPHVRTGLTLDGIVWAFTTGYAANWHPLTWVSHMLDCQLFGLNPTGHHLMNLLIHVANTVLLFLAFKRMTGASWQSAFVAALFGLHPFHVESVAWASERKDVLSTLFWILTMWAYVRYVEKPGAKRYLLVLFVFALGLLAKPMLVTLPFVLLLLDYWPLRRFQIAESNERSKLKSPARVNLKAYKSIFLRLLREKIPILALAVISSMVTYLVQRSVAMSFGEMFPLQLRIGNALLSYVSYIEKTIWPHDLALLYVHRAMSPEWQVVMLPLWKVAGAAAVLVLLSVLLIRATRQRPYFAVGWLWYLGTLVPVIGIVQVGEQAMADRYTYVPLIGLLIVIAWGVPGLFAKVQKRKIILASASVVVLGAIMISTRKQVEHWQNSITLFENTIRATETNPVAHYNLGYALHMQGKLNEAIPHYMEALRIVPFYKEAHSMLESALQAQGNFEKLAEAKSNYGTALGKQGRFDEAIRYFSEALHFKPNLADAHNNFGIVLAVQGRTVEAREHFSEAVRANPNHWNAHFNLGLVLSKEGKLEEAISQFSEALRIRPDYKEARNELERVRQLTNRGQ